MPEGHRKSRFSRRLVALGVALPVGLGLALAATFAFAEDDNRTGLISETSSIRDEKPASAGSLASATDDHDGECDEEPAY